LIRPRDVGLLLLRVLLAVALYGFLGTVFLLLWRDLRRPQESAPVAKRRYGQLVVVDIETQMDGSLDIGTTFSLQPVTSLGRSALNTIIIPDAYASAEHALLVYRDGRWWLEDRGSRNGTTVNAMPIDAPTVLTAGDVLGIGRVQLKLEPAEL
jgi:pSer/pThr/pTyr-binding forkhead associated (FHA) protein